MKNVQKSPIKLEVLDGESLFKVNIKGIRGKTELIWGYYFEIRVKFGCLGRF
jgi:hypothetical protein